MFDFQCDYTEGCHPAILERLVATNMEQAAGYGDDKWCEAARLKIREACGQKDAQVFFLSGGTQANLTVISALLRPYQGVVATEEAHIATHETGAIEATGHKVLTLPGQDGKLCARAVEAVLQEHAQSPIREHMVQPGMVYITFPTESGTLYSKKELEALREVCTRHKAILYVDGARLGYGLASPENDLSLADIARLCDAFYIGGTKCGALCGEAVVIPDKALADSFRYSIKQRGGLLAKGRLLGLQFSVLFENSLYIDGCRTAVEQALAIRTAFEQKGIRMHGASSTNQQFPVLTAEQAAILGKRHRFETWESEGESSIVRFCTSWATTQEAVDALIADIAALAV